MITLLKFLLKLESIQVLIKKCIQILLVHIILSVIFLVETSKAWLSFALLENLVVSFTTLQMANLCLRQWRRKSLSILSLSLRYTTNT